MRLYPSLASCALVALVSLSCGDTPQPEETTAPDESEARAGNRPPIIESVEVQPRAPRTGDPITLSIKALDPDGDDVEVLVDWYRNGQLEEEGGHDRLETTGYRRGERIRADVRVSDGSEEAVHTTPDVNIANTPARVTSLELFPPKPAASDTLLVEAKAFDPDGDSYELRYRWRLNGEVLADATTNSFPPNRLKRGDELEVSVSALDGQDEGEWYVAEPLKLGNGLPKISSAPGRTLASATRYEYAIQASDPDGDKPLRYRLVKGPSGMQVDLVSGVVSWEVPETADGKFEIEVAVSDAYGGESSQAYTLEFHWQSAAPAAPADAEARPETQPADEAGDEPEAEPEPEEQL